MTTTLDRLERKVPALAHKALREAYKRALKAGSVIVLGNDGVLYEVRSDGSRRKLKKVKSGIAVKRGTKFKVK